MPSTSAFGSAHRQYVQSLYKRTLKNSLDWTIRRDVWRAKAMEIRAQFDYNRNVTDPRQLAQILEQAEAKLAAWKHPDPYIPPTAPNGTKWERNLPPSTESPYAHDEEPSSIPLGWFRVGPSGIEEVGGLNAETLPKLPFRLPPGQLASGWYRTGPDGIEGIDAEIASQLKSSKTE
ncbi:hypothetical protein DFH07DRAFT_845058 [Mycena maculata]|uniref:NADH dehydrogenase [ubiquinone] 1 beta subcomplex subunit 9 n=1 Tax=Mycena maculata TaxID=230809 RepID=A0AAD7I3Y3_9AGAR|nr:hypothetical protein DFH07DRAFT_845058 [Mycena maculata]